MLRPDGSLVNPTSNHSPLFRLRTFPHAGSLTVHVLKDVHDGEDLTVIGHQGLAHHVRRHHQVLQDLERHADDLPVPEVQGIYTEGKEQATIRSMNSTTTRRIDWQTS